MRKHIKKTIVGYCKMKKKSYAELTKNQLDLFNEHEHLIEDAVGIAERKYGLDKADAESIAYEELLNAVRKYDPNKGPLKNQFFTYVNNMVQNAWLKTLRDQGRDTNNEKQLKDKIKKLENLTPTPEIIDEINVLTKKLDELKDKSTKSLDYKPSDDEGNLQSFYDLLEDGRATAQNMAEYEDLIKKIYSELKNDRARQIFKLLLDGNTYLEITHHLNPDKSPFKFDKKENRWYDPKTKRYVPETDPSITPDTGIDKTVQVSYIYVNEILPLLKKEIYALQ